MRIVIEGAKYGCALKLIVVLDSNGKRLPNFNEQSFGLHQNLPLVMSYDTLNLLQIR